MESVSLVSEVNKINYEILTDSVFDMYLILLLYSVISISEM